MSKYFHDDPVECARDRIQFGSKRPLVCQVLLVDGGQLRLEYARVVSNVGGCHALLDRYGGSAQCFFSVRPVWTFTNFVQTRRPRFGSGAAAMSNGQLSSAVGLVYVRPSSGILSDQGA